MRLPLIPRNYCRKNVDVMLKMNETAIVKGNA